MKRPETERPIFPGKYPLRKISDERGVSPVIAVILMVAITVVLAAVLYVMVYNIINLEPPTPNGAMDFEENDHGTYIGRIIRIDREVELKDLSITITDISTSNSASMDPLSDGAIASCGSGQLNITYDDINNNENLDAADVFVIHNGESDDIIVLTYTKGSGGQITKVTLT